MDFLDDLRDQKTPKPQPQEKRPKRAPSTDPNTQDKTAWDELLGNVKFEEEPATARKGRQAHHRGQGSGLSRGQRAILAVLALAAVGLWTVVILALTGSLSIAIPGLARPEAAAPGSTGPALQELPQEKAPQEETVPPLPTNTPPSAAESQPTATVPTAVPIPIGPLTTAYDAQLRNDPTNVGLYLQRGHEFLRVGAFDAALQDFDTAVELDDQRAEAYEGRGWANYYLFRWGTASEAFDIAIARNEELPRAHFGLGLIHYHRGSYRNAAREFDWAAEIDPLQAEYEAWLAMAAARLDDRTEALGAATRAISLTQNISLVYVARSWARRIDVPSDFDGAQGDLLYARNLEPNDFLALGAIAEFYQENRPERLGEAEQLATYALNWATNDVEEAIALQTLGRIYLQQGRKNDALRVFETAVVLASREGEILLVGLGDDLAAARD